MANGQRLLLLRSAALVTLAVSAALLAAYLRPHSIVCGFDFDCEEMLSSPHGKLLGAPLPLWGILTFAAIFACTLSARSRWLWLLRFLALAAGIGGMSLIFVQVFVLRRVCPLCMIVDSCALIVAYAVFAGRGEVGAMPLGRMRWLWLTSPATALLGGAALGTAGSWLAKDDRVPTPPQVSAHWVAGKINVVEITDFVCPHCREAHPFVTRAVREEGDRIHFVRIVAPMPKHEHGRDAARAYLAAWAQGKGDEMAELLFAAREQDLTPEGCEGLAESLGLSLSSYRSCVAAPETDSEIDANLEWVKSACPQGLPCIWMQDQRLLGLRGSMMLRDAFLAAERRPGAPAR